MHKSVEALRRGAMRGFPRLMNTFGVGSDFGQVLNKRIRMSNRWNLVLTMNIRRSYFEVDLKKKEDSVDLGVGLVLD